MRNTHSKRNGNAAKFFPFSLIFLKLDVVTISAINRHRPYRINLPRVTVPHHQIMVTVFDQSNQLGYRGAPCFYDYHSAR
ncbi:MAG: hypothetical protein WAT12_01280 [Candidatus Nitrotoga sp.]